MFPGARGVEAAVPRRRRRRETSVGNWQGLRHCGRVKLPDVFGFFPEGAQRSGLIFLRMSGRSTRERITRIDVRRALLFIDSGAFSRIEVYLSAATKVVRLNWVFPSDNRRHSLLFHLFRSDLKLLCLCGSGSPKWMREKQKEIHTYINDVQRRNAHGSSKGSLRQNLTIFEKKRRCCFLYIFSVGGRGLASEFMGEVQG